ncbi:MAG: sulfotransferase [Halioglobus sp.]|nr:sulfotransferase [Halioglobus sp.]
MHMIIKRLIKWLVRAISVFLPEAKAHDLQRWRRGKEEFWKYRNCDFIFASFGKSGRTWVRVMISRYFQLEYQLPDNILMGFDNFTRINKNIPKIFFTHDNYLRGYTGNVDSKKDFYDKKTILLVRDPRDVAVSQFHQWKYRMRPEKKAMNNYPEHDADISVYDFVKHEGQGLNHIIDFMNAWATELDKIQDLLVIRYEDMKSHPEREMQRVVEFLGLEPNDEYLADTAEFASVENLRKKEQENYFWRSGSRVQAKDVNDPNTFKVRKAKVGGYRDYFDDDQVEEFRAMVDARLAPVFGYTSAEQEPQSRAEEAS